MLAGSCVQSTTIVIPQAGKALVEEVHRIAAAPVGGTFSFAWQNEKIDRDSVTLLPTGQVRVCGPRYPAGADKTVEWDITAPEAGSAEVRLVYAVDGLTLTPETAISLSPTGEVAELVHSATLTNDTGCRFANATICAGGTRFTEPALDVGQVCAIEFLRAAQVRITRALVVDTARFGNAVAVILCFENTVPAGLGVMPIAASKIRVFQNEPDGGRRLIGESTLPRVGIGERAEFLAAFEQGIAVQRQLAASQQVNIRKNASGRMVAFDLEEEVCLDLESRLPNDADLQVIEHVEGHWEPLGSSVPGTRLDAATISFPLKVPAFQKVQLRFRYLRRNLAP